MDQLVDPVERGERLLVEHGGDQVGVDVPEDRRHLQDAAGRERKEVDPMQQHIAHGWGHSVDTSPGAADLAHEERVSAGPVHDRGDDVGVDRGVHVSEQLGDLAGREAGEDDAWAGPRQLAKQTVQWVVRLDIGVPVRPDDREARGARPAGHGPQQLERTRVRPVQVIEHHGDRTPPPDLVEEVGDHVEGSEADLVCDRFWSRRALRCEAGQQGNDLRRHRHGADQRLQRLGPWPERRGPVPIRAGPPQHQSAVGGGPQRLIGEPRLADPCLARDQHERAVTAGSAGDRRLDRRQRISPTHERIARRMARAAGAEVVGHPASVAT